MGTPVKEDQIYTCPACGELEDFRIEGTTTVTCYVDGKAEVHDSEDGDIEWGDDSTMLCATCDHTATVKDFEIDTQQEAQLSLVDGLVLFCDVCHQEVEEFCNGHISLNGVKRCVNCFLAEEGPQA